MAKKSKDKPEPQSTIYYFYTQERWENWLRTLEEMDFEGDPESEEMPEGLQSLSNFTEDINIAVLKIVKLYQSGSYSEETARAKLDEVEHIVMGALPDSEVADIISGVQMRFLVLFVACKKVFAGDVKGEIKDLVKEGRSLSDDDAEQALEIAGTIGALVLEGGSCCGKYLRGDFDDPSLFDEWIIEVDDMGTALKSLKNFEEQFGEGI